ncbi:MAG: transaldolase, partial [Proteobacteria bacterium]|nr:transaldolase [Pseudomonadota bacterium]
MSTSLTSLIQSGTKLWLDSVDPELTVKSKTIGITGATSNPIIIADLLKGGRFDPQLNALAQDHLSAEEITWEMTNFLVSQAEEVFRPIYDRSHGDDGYVSFELDPLLEDRTCILSISDRSKKYVELAKKWSKGHPNRMIKV